MIGVLLGAALAVSAQAQTFDGVYKGAFTVKRQVGTPGSECPRVGGHIAITINARGGSVTLTHAFATYSGTVDRNGRVEIRGSRPTASGAGRISTTYSGTIRRRIVSGPAFAIGPGGECHGTFSARR
jgi:hypothetical protein